MVWLVVAIGAVASVIALLLIAYGPRWWHARREPTDAEIDRLTSLTTASDADARSDSAAVDTDSHVNDAADHATDFAAGFARIAVLRSASSTTEPVQITGLPRRRELLISDAALTNLDDETLRVLLADERERARTVVDVVQALSVGVVVAILVAMYATPLSFGGALVGWCLFALVAFAGCRRLHYAADARAAEHVGQERLADALERAAALRGAEPQTGSWGTLFEVEPPLGDRIARLRRLEPDSP